MVKERSRDEDKSPSAQPKTDEVRIRLERPEDVDAVYAVNLESFPSPAEARLVDALRSNGNLTASLVAVLGERVIGHVGFSPVSVANAEHGYGLAPLAVSEESRRQGIGDRLVRAGLEQIASRGGRFVVLLGDPAYYQRFGFQAASGFGLQDEYGGGDAFQVLALSAGGIPNGAGLVRYSREFADLED